jgi:hypothetical protein
MEVYRTKNNLDSRQYVRPVQLQKLLGVSRTTVWKLLNGFTAVKGNERAVLDLSQTLKLVPLHEFMDWLKSQNGKYLQK